MLGLQWRVGTPYEQAVQGLRNLVEPNSTAVFGVLDGDRLWATLVLGFDADHEITLVTTVDPAKLSHTDREGVASELVQWVQQRHPRCSFGVVTDLDGARELLVADDKPATVRTLEAADRLARLPVHPVPEAR